MVDITDKRDELDFGKNKEKLDIHKRREVPRSDKTKNRILRELYNNYLENINSPDKEGLNVSELYRNIEKSQYNCISNAVNDLEFFSNAVISKKKMVGNISKRFVKLDPSWINAVKKNYEINNGDITIFNISENMPENRISFLEHKRYIEFLFSIYGLDTKLKFNFYDNIEDLKNNNRLSELRQIDLEYIHIFLSENIEGFTISSLKKPKILELLIKMGKRKLLKNFDIIN